MPAKCEHATETAGKEAIMTMPTTGSMNSGRTYKSEASRNASAMLRMSLARRSHTKKGPVFR